MCRTHTQVLVPSGERGAQHEVQEGERQAEVGLPLGHPAQRVPLHHIRQGPALKELIKAGFRGAVFWSWQFTAWL